MDSIIARGLTFQACHGAEAWEKKQAQTFLVDVEMFLDLKTAGHTDDLNQTINYAQAYQLVEKKVTTQSFNLIEALAENIAETLLTAFPGLVSVEVTVYKPEAPVAGSFDYFAVKIKRFQK